MDLKQNPFSFYDFLGYFVPGSFLIYFFIIFSNYTSLENNETIRFIEAQDLKGIELYAPLILLAYICGHLASFLSALTIEKHTNWIYGSPSKTLLGHYQKSYFSNGPEHFRNNLLRCIVFVSILPVSVLDMLFNKVLGSKELLNKPLDDLSKEILEQKVRSILKEHGQVNNTDIDLSAPTNNFFLYIYHFALENTQNHAPKMQNYVALFGLMRTITFCFVVFFWVAMWHLTYNKSELKSLIVIVLITTIPTYIFYLAFIKFYRRFTLESLMAACSVESIETKT